MQSMTHPRPPQPYKSQGLPSFPRLACLPAALNRDVSLLVEHNVVISTSHDASVRLWNMAGNPLGIVTCSSADSRLEVRVAVPWRFQFDGSHER